MRDGRALRSGITLAMQALGERDDELARKVIDGDQLIDCDENEIDELALQILATRQPVACRRGVGYLRAPACSAEGGSLSAPIDRAPPVYRSRLLMRRT